MAWEEAGGKGLNLAVVCTKSEDINLGAARTEFCRLGKAISPDTMVKLDDDIATAREAGDGRLKKDLKTRCVPRHFKRPLIPILTRVLQTKAASDQSPKRPRQRRAAKGLRVQGPR